MSDPSRSTRVFRSPVFWGAVQSIAAVVTVVLTVLMSVEANRQLDRGRFERLENFVNNQAVETERLRQHLQRLQTTPGTRRPGGVLFRTDAPPPE